MTAIDTAPPGPAAAAGSEHDGAPSGSSRRRDRPRALLTAILAPRASRQPRSAGLVVGMTISTVISLSAMWLLLYALVFSGVQERSTQHRLYASIRSSLAQQLVPFGGSIKAGTPVAVLSVPGAGVTRAVVVEGTTSGDLRGGPGHQQNTALPGQAGVSVIMGRSLTFGAPFRHVTSLHRGDAIAVTTGQGQFRYIVSDVRTSGDLLPPALGAGAGRLTLVTSHGNGWRAGWAPDTSAFVDATLQGKAAGTPAGRPATIPSDAAEMSSDTGGLVYLVLWLQALLVLAIGFVWARSRWGTWQTWLAGAPAILAVVWLASSEATRLLPNLV